MHSHQPKIIPISKHAIKKKRTKKGDFNQDSKKIKGTLFSIERLHIFFSIIWQPSFLRESYGSLEKTISMASRTPKPWA